MENLISVCNINVSYKKNHVLKDVSFTLKAGKIYGFIGPNGAGKTTTIKTLLGLLKPDSGEIYYKGEKTDNLFRASDGKIGALVNSPAFYGDLSAKENMQVVCKMKCIGEEEIDKILKTIRLDNTGNKKCKNFSMGMKQRLGIAEALLGKPNILILDEPINGLDPQGIYEIRELIINLKEKYHMTILISSHVLNELEMVCEETIIIDDGSIRFCGNIEELKELTKLDNLEECYFKLLKEGRKDDGNRMV